MDGAWPVALGYLGRPVGAVLAASWTAWHNPGRSTKQSPGQTKHRLWSLEFELGGSHQPQRTITPGLACVQGVRRPVRDGQDIASQSQ